MRLWINGRQTLAWIQRFELDFQVNENNLGRTCSRHKLYILEEYIKEKLEEEIEVRQPNFEELENVALKLRKMFLFTKLKEKAEQRRDNTNTRKIDNIIDKHSRKLHQINWTMQKNDLHMW